jgi:hypothetical protein
MVKETAGRLKSAIVFELDPMKRATQSSTIMKCGRKVVPKRRLAVAKPKKMLFQSALSIAAA